MGSNQCKLVLCFPYQTHTPSFARAGVEGLDKRARFLDVSEAMEKTSIDYYASIRSVFSQNRRFEIRNGVPEPITDIYGDSPSK